MVDMNRDLVIQIHISREDLEALGVDVRQLPSEYLYRIKDRYEDMVQDNFTHDLVDAIEAVGITRSKV